MLLVFAALLLMLSTRLLMLAALLLRLAAVLFKLAVLTLDLESLPLALSASPLLFSLLFAPPFYSHFFDVISDFFFPFPAFGCLLCFAVFVFFDDLSLLFSKIDFRNLSIKLGASFILFFCSLRLLRSSFCRPLSLSNAASAA